MKPSTEDLGRIKGSAVEQDFLTLLPELARRIRSHGDNSARRHRTWAQLMIVRRLEQQPGLAQDQLAAIAELAPITATRLIDRIETFGLLRRDADPKDRRIWRLRTTSAAAPVLRDSERWSAELDELLIEGVDSAALDATILGLRKMKSNLSSRTTSAGAARHQDANGVDRRRIGNREGCSQLGRSPPMHS